MQLLSQGAEAKIYLTTFLGDQAIIKQRLQKQYRHPLLDSRITQERIKNESKIMVKARKLGINVPYLLNVNENSIYMMYIDGIKLKEYLQTTTAILYDVGVQIAKLHNANIIHGDLTTSNILVKNDLPYFIDFGLSYIKQGNLEDYAVDLYVLEKAFLSTHPTLEKEFQEILKAYGNTQEQGMKVLDKLEQVRARGRKKLAFG